MSTSHEGLQQGGREKAISRKSTEGPKEGIRSYPTMMAQT